MDARKYIYRFGKGSAEGNRDQKELLGGKGANLAEMSRIGLPIPSGFTITSEACHFAVSREFSWPDELQEQVMSSVQDLEEKMGRELGNADNPLLVSVRSGAAESMPGMMDTILNLGLNDLVVEGVAQQTGNERFAWDSYRRFINMYGNVVSGISSSLFEAELDEMKEQRGVTEDTELEVDDLKKLTVRYKEIFLEETGAAFPQEAYEQLFTAINAVFKSWNNPRAIKYRQVSGINGLKGTAVSVQAMVFGNTGDNSGTGVCFTRNPATGESKIFGEFLINAQGEDVVAGIRTPLDIQKLHEVMPEVHERLVQVTRQLENHYRNMQDIEFTVQDGELYILQTRTGKRTGPAAVKIAVDMVTEGLVDRRTAISRMVQPSHLDQLLHPQLADEEVSREDLIARGLPASPGAAVGRVVFDSDRAAEEHEKGEPVILVRTETSPEDVGGMSAAEGILTSRGGMTSHAAVVARGWGKPCIAGCGEIVIDYKNRTFTNGRITVREGDWISLDGSTGKVINGRKTLMEPSPGPEYETLMSWIGEIQTMQVRGNADTPEDAAGVYAHGATGIGLTRTEHMFFSEGRINGMRKMIVAEGEHERREALEQLLPFQREDFEGIFRAMKGLPVTIRLLDPPLHEFLPQEEDEIRAVARELEITPGSLKAKMDQLKEYNPMLGHRGCRLGITFPEITEMQTRAIIEAAINLKEEGLPAKPEIMIPLVGSAEEFRDQRKVVDRTALEVFEETGTVIDYEVGTMIEVPRAALMADRIARDADFFSFGTNDLTQMTYGFSRDDAVKFLPEYESRGVLKHDPFQILDREGVGQLVEMATERGRSVKPGLKVGICGEHGGEPSSIDFCFELGLDYVSCSPYRIPIARLASAQARLRSDQLEALQAEEEDSREMVAE